MIEIPAIAIKLIMLIASIFMCIGHAFAAADAVIITKEISTAIQRLIVAFFSLLSIIAWLLMLQIKG